MGKVYKNNELSHGLRRPVVHTLYTPRKVTYILEIRESPKTRYWESSAVTGLAEDQQSHCFKLAVSRKTNRTTAFIITISACVTCACTRAEACTGAQRAAFRVDSLSIFMWD